MKKHKSQQVTQTSQAQMTACELFGYQLPTVTRSLLRKNRTTPHWVGTQVRTRHVVFQDCWHLKSNRNIIWRIMKGLPEKYVRFWLFWIPNFLDPKVASTFVWEFRTPGWSFALWDPSLWEGSECDSTRCALELSSSKGPHRFFYPFGSEGDLFGSTTRTWTLGWPAAGRGGKVYATLILSFFLWDWLTGRRLSIGDGSGSGVLSARKVKEEPHQCFVGSSGEQ